MQVGGRRLIRVPFNTETGLTPETDVYLVVDLPCRALTALEPTDAQVEAEVEDSRRVGQFADGDVIDAGLADLAGDLEGQAAARLEHDRPT